MEGVGERGRSPADRGGEPAGSPKAELCGKASVIAL